VNVRREEHPLHPVSGAFAWTATRTSLAVVAMLAAGLWVAGGERWTFTATGALIAAAVAAVLVSIALYGALRRLVVTPLEPLIHAAGAALPGRLPEAGIPETDIGAVLRAWNRLRTHADDTPARAALAALIHTMSHGLQPGSSTDVGPLVDELLKCALLVVHADVALLRLSDAAGPVSRLGRRRLVHHALPAHHPLVQALDALPAALEARTAPSISTDTGRLGATGLAHLPIRAEGQIIGILSVARRTPFDARDQEALTALAGYLSLTVEHLQLSHRVFEQATRDALTGVLTRRYVLEALTRELARAQATNAPVSILMVDLDGFKMVNDRHGHQAGDAVLARVAAVLARTVRYATSVGRYGGDEFLVVLPGMPHATAIDVGVRLRDAVRAALRDPRAELPADLAVTPSVGVATSSEHGTTSEALIASADEALYAAKARGRNRVESAALTARPGPVLPHR